MQSTPATHFGPIRYLNLFPYLEEENEKEERRKKLNNMRNSTRYMLWHANMANMKNYKLNSRALALPSRLACWLSSSRRPSPPSMRAAPSRPIRASSRSSTRALCARPTRAPQPSPTLAPRWSCVRSSRFPVTIVNEIQLKIPRLARISNVTFARPRRADSDKTSPDKRACDFRKGNLDEMKVKIVFKFFYEKFLSRSAAVSIGQSTKSIPINPLTHFIHFYYMFFFLFQLQRTLNFPFRFIERSQQQQHIWYTFFSHVIRWEVTNIAWDPVFLMLDARWAVHDVANLHTHITSNARIMFS